MTFKIVNKHLLSVIIEMLSWIEINIKTKLSINDVVNKSGYSRWYFQRKFTLVTGHSVANYISRRKMDIASEMLLTSDLSIINIATMLGYDEESTFCRAFRRQYGLPPSVYRRTSDSKRPHTHSSTP